MSHLLRLYPRAWRERYGDEMLALLETQPASPLDQLDLIRGALDARLHPQVHGAATIDKETPMNQRILAILAGVGGIAWIVGTVTAVVLPPNTFGDADTSLMRIGVAIGAILIAIALGELGTRTGSSSWTGHAIAIVGVALGLTALLDWPWFMLALIGFPILVVLATTRANLNGRLPGWATGLIVAVSVVALVGMFGTSALVGASTNALFFGFIGVAGLVLAVAARRSPVAPALTAPTQEPA
ncbi:MAG TPA: hypothetical protein VIF84_02700 [Candidatus Limnocylindrales bacterium]|jgi:lysylphosphatidylglycerol synthetase-like protein (DUF2156 family)